MPNRSSITQPPDANLVPPLAKPVKDPAAVSLGRKGGLKGGKARAALLSAKERSEAASKAAKARWAKPKSQQKEE